MKSTEKIFWGIFALIVIAIVAFVMVQGGKNTEARTQALAGFAQCIADSKAIFYGAFWCPHCQNQKALFAGAQNLLPYVECSTPDQRGQLPVCTEAEITSYPTWVFADESRETGEVTLATLSEKTGCELPTL